jgi:transcriptional regulator with GAF, ATPase, and Fis domain
VQRLVVVHPPPEGDEPPASIVLGRAATRIGRKGFVPPPLGFDDPQMSREHAVLVYDGAQHACVVTDLGSRNGVRVDGKRVEEKALADQSVLRAGGTLLVFEECDVESVPWKGGETPLGASLKMRKVQADLATVGPTGVPVLVTGETGVGKELVARTLHEKSGRKGAFVAVNCGALQESVAESELFGHVAGAFTGASGASEGLFAAARGGTLLLDEIGEMPLSLQPKLLRALATGEVRPVGASRSTTVDVRVVAATNRDLEAAVADGSFRADLFARLAGWVIQVPSLRARREDILPLARTFLKRGGGSVALSVDAAESLLTYGWPFNVRELEHVIAAGRLRAAGGQLKRQHLPPAMRRDDPAPVASEAEAGEIPLPLLVPPDRTPSKEGLETDIARLAGNVVRVAEYFGKDRRQIYRWASRYGIDVETFREP